MPRASSVKKPATRLFQTRRRPQSIIASNIAISRFVDSGDLNSARHVFDRMPQRSAVSWNAIISGLAKWGLFEESLARVSSMHSSNSGLNETTLSSALSSCTRSDSPAPGKQLHCLVLKSGHEGFDFVSGALLNLYTSIFEIESSLRLFESLCSRNPMLWTLMLVGFVRFNMMGKALDLFDRMPNRDIVAWTAVISGYSQCSSAAELGKALELFVLLVRSGEAAPNEYTYDAVLRICSKSEALGLGRAVHGCLVRCGFESNSSTAGALIGLYCNCALAEEAHRIFWEIPSPCMAVSRSMIAGLLSAGRIADAELVFRRTPHPCPSSYNQMIKAYADAGRTAESKLLFDQMPSKNTVTLNTMITIHHQAGELQQALSLFESMKEETNTVTWNSMISGYVLNEEPAEALKLFALMQRDSVASSRSTFSVLLRACASIGALKQGAMLHGQLCKSPFESNLYAGTSLVDMYAKCGSIADARAAFLDIVFPNVASWTALISALAHHGSGTEAVLEFGRMLKHGVQPNVVTFVGLIMACGREGMVDQGMSFFLSMERWCGSAPTVEHYSCVVDLLGRAGRVKEAEEFVLGMPIEADCVIWGSLLNACWFFMELEVGERVAWRLLCLESKHVSGHVTMSNIYAKLGRWGEVVEVRRRLRRMAGRKEPGCSWVEGKDGVHVFCVEDKRHPERNEIDSILEDLYANMMLLF